MKLQAEPLLVWADSTRLHQLLDNLFSNLSKYAEIDAVLSFQVTPRTGVVVLDIQDSGPGVPEEALLHLFDYLYRVESSRNRQTGGSGLGLAICRKIVDAHDGSIEAMKSPLGGLWIQVKLPVMA